MINSCCKVYLWWFKWIVGWEVNIKEEDTSRVGRVFRPHNSCLPVEHIISDWTSRTVGRWVFSKINQLLQIKFIRRLRETQVKHKSFNGNATTDIVSHNDFDVDGNLQMLFTSMRCNPIDQKCSSISEFLSIVRLKTFFKHTSEVKSLLTFDSA